MKQGFHNRPKTEGEKMRERQLPALIMLLAGAITCIFDIYRKAELLPSLKRLLAVLIIFYILGLIAREIITKTLSSKKKNVEPVADSMAENIPYNEENDNENDNTNINLKHSQSHNGPKDVKNKKASPVNERE